MAELVHADEREQSSEALRLDEILGARQGRVLVSVECFPPRSDEGVIALFKTLHLLANMSPRPAFLDFTWGAGGSTSDLTLDLCARAQSELVLPTNMHLTCTNMEAGKIDAALATCKERGIRNILALRGDPPAGEQRWASAQGGFSCALDLVAYIRAQHGTHFCVSVAGYPEGHPDAMTSLASTDGLSAAELARCSTVVSAAGETSYSVCLDAQYAAELAYLRQKVEAGAACVITQMFFDAEVYGAFVAACRAAGIAVPIVPGIMLVNSYAGFTRMSNMCKTRVPPALQQQLEKAKGDEALMGRLAVDFGVATCRRLVELGAPCLHFYTLNASAPTLAVVQQLQLP